MKCLQITIKNNREKLKQITENINVHKIFFLPYLLIFY